MCSAENSCKRICVENGKNVEEISQHEERERQSESPDDETLDRLSEKCVSFYKKLARRLGLKFEKIEEISRDNVNYGSLSEKCFQVLHEWKESNSTPFTNETLEKALRSLGKNALANEYFGNK